MFNILFLMIILGNPISVAEVSVKNSNNKTVFTNTQFNLESGIKRLYPDIKDSNLQMVMRVIKTKASKYGFSKKDYPLIIAMIMTESTFKHIKFGKYGEVGMLQVIPKEGHIKKCVALGVKCKSSEKYCKKTGRPDIYGIKGRIRTYKVKRFLAAHSHYALETGFCEMSWWKKRWKKKVQRRLWKYFPKKHMIRRIGLTAFEINEVKIRHWWTLTKKRCGNMLWVSSYNWGGVIPRGAIFRWYPITVLRYYNMSLGRRKRTVFSRPTFSSKNVILTQK